MTRNRFELPLVSVGVPTFNRPESLMRTLQALSDQTYPNIEVVVSDNCSTNPEVSNVLRCFANDNRFKIFRQPINRGAFFNFNFVLERLRGAYFMRLADDDWIDNDYIKTCQEFLEKNPDYVIAYGVTSIFSPENEFRYHDTELELNQSEGSDRVRHYFEKVGYNAIYYGLANIAYKNYFFVQQKLGDDWAAVARAAFAGKIKLIRETNQYVSLGGLSKSTDNLVTALNFSNFTRSFPHLSIALNIMADVIWKCPIYKRLPVTRRIRLAIDILVIIYRRFNVRDELLLRYRRKGYKK